MPFQTNDRIMNTAIYDQPISATAYPFISGLRAIGMEAILLDGKIGLTPSERVTPKMMEIATTNRAAIIAEIESIAKIAAESLASDTIGTSTPNAMWADPNHDMQKLEHVMIAMFYHVARLGWSSAQYWAGPTSGLPAPQRRPYCYIKSIWAQNAKTLKSEYIYWPVIADSDGIDYVWDLPEVAWGHADKTQAFYEG